MQKKLSGVDIELGNESSKSAYGFAKETFVNRQSKPGEVKSKTEGGFSGLLQFGKLRIGIGSDGIGTKAEVAERTGIYHTLGYDLVAMVADDLAAMGFEPTNLSNVIDVDFLDKSIISELMRGLRDACNFAGIAITGGEIAELGNRIKGYGDKMHFNWSSTAIGILPDFLSQAPDGSRIQAGDRVIALRSRGFRSNGFSSVRRILQAKFGDKWHNAKYDNQETWGEKVLTPSLIYAPVINTIIAARKDLKSIVHITGGGIFDNFRRVLKVTDSGAELDNLFEPHPEMLKLQEYGNVSREDAYLWWNMGNGMLLTVSPEDEKEVLEILKQENYQAQSAGRIINSPEIQIRFKNCSLQKKY